MAPACCKIAPHNFPGEGVWFLNPLSWQFLFVIGMAGMMHVGAAAGSTEPVMAAGAVFYLVGALCGFAFRFGASRPIGPAHGADRVRQDVPVRSRLLHILASAILWWRARLSNLARTRPDNPLAVLGKHSLPVFVAGTLLAMVCR